MFCFAVYKFNISLSFDVLKQEERCVYCLKGLLAFVFAPGI